MSSHIDPKITSLLDARKVWSVSDFARKQGLDRNQERELVQLFGHFATKQELMANCLRPRLTR